MEGGADNVAGTFSVSITVKNTISEVSEQWVKCFHHCELEKEYLSKSSNKTTVSWEEWKNLISFEEKKHFSAEYFQHGYLFLLHNLNTKNSGELIRGYEALSKHLEEDNDLTPFEYSILTNILQIPYIWVLVLFSFKMFEQETATKQLKLFFSNLNRKLKKPKQNNLIHDNNDNNNDNITLNDENDTQNKEKGENGRVILKKEDIRVIIASSASLSLYFSCSAANLGNIRELLKTLDKINAKRPLGIFWTLWYQRQYMDDPTFISNRLNIENFLSIPVEEEELFDFSKLLTYEDGGEEKQLCERGVKCPSNMDHFKAFVSSIIPIMAEHGDKNIEKCGLVARYVKLMQQYVDDALETDSRVFYFQNLIEFFVVFCTLHPLLMFEKINHLLRIFLGELNKFSSEELSEIESGYIYHAKIVLLIFYGFLQLTHLSIEIYYPHIIYDENDPYILENTTPLDISNLHDFEKVHTHQVYYRDHRTLEDPKVINEFIKTLQINMHLLTKLSGTKVTSIEDLLNGPIKKIIQMNEEIYESQPNSELVQSVLLFYSLEEISTFLDDYILKLDEEDEMLVILDYYIEVLRICSSNKEDDRYIQILPKIDKIFNDFPDLVKKKTKCDVLTISATIFAVRDQIDESKKFLTELKEIYTASNQRANYLKVYSSVLPYIRKGLSSKQVLEDIDSLLLSPFVGLTDLNTFDNLLYLKGEELEAMEEKLLSNREAIFNYYSLYISRSKFLQFTKDFYGAFRAILLCVKLLSMTEKDTFHYVHEEVIALFQLTFQVLQADRRMKFDNDDDLLHSLHYYIEYYSSYFDRRMKMIVDSTNLSNYIQFIKVLLRFKEYEKAMKYSERLITFPVYKEVYEDYWTANRLYVESCLGLKQYEKAKEFTNQVKSSKLAEFIQIITLEKRIQLKELQQKEKWLPNLHRFYTDEFIAIANTILVLHQRNNLPPAEKSLRASSGISNDDSNDNFFSLLPIEIIYQIVESLADFPQYQLLSSPITGPYISPNPQTINDTPISLFYSKLFDLVYLMPAEYWEKNFDSICYAFSNSRKVTMQLSLYLSKLSGEFSYDENAQGIPIFDSDQWFVVTPDFLTFNKNVNLRRDQILRGEMEINDTNSDNAELNYADSSVVKLRIALFELYRIPPSLRNITYFNQIFEFLLKRDDEFLIVIPKTGFIHGYASVNTSTGPLDGLQYHAKRFLSNSNRFNSEFDDFLSQLTEKAEEKSNSPIKFERKILTPIEEIPRIAYEEIERFFIGDKNTATDEELHNCLLSTFRETFPCDHDDYRKVETILKNTLKILESKEKKEGELNNKTIEDLEDFLRKVSDALFEEFRNNYKTSDYLPTDLSFNYFPITTFLESIFLHYVAKELFMSVNCINGLSLLAH